MNTKHHIASPLERKTHEDATAGEVLRTFPAPQVIEAEADLQAQRWTDMLPDVLAELQDTTKVWWKSKVILSLIAALIMLGLQKFEWLPAWVTQDNLVSFLLVAIPLVAGIVARFGATDRVVAVQPPTIEGNYHVDS